MSEKVKCGQFIKEVAPEPVIEYMLQKEDFWEDREHFFEQATIGDKNEVIDLIEFYIFLKDKNTTELPAPVPHHEAWIEER